MSVLKPVLLAFFVLILLVLLTIGVPVGEVTGKIIDGSSLDSASAKFVSANFYVVPVKLSSGEVIEIHSKYHLQEGYSVSLTKNLSLLSFKYQYKLANEN